MLNAPRDIQQIDGTTVTRLIRPTPVAGETRITTVRGGQGTLQNQDGGGTNRLDYSNEELLGGSQQLHIRVADAAGDTLQIKQGNHAPETFAPGDVDVANDSVQIENHDYYTGQLVQFSTTGTLPAGLSAATDYFIIVVDKDNFQVATSKSNALDGTQIDITDQGSGVHTITGWHNVVFPPNLTLTDNTAAALLSFEDGWTVFPAAESYTIQGEGAATIVQYYWE